MKLVEDWLLAECHHYLSVENLSSFVLDHVAVCVANRMVLHTLCVI